MKFDHTDPKIHAYKVFAIAVNIKGEVKFRNAIISKEEATSINYEGVVPVDICHREMGEVPAVLPTKKNVVSSSDVVMNKMERFPARDPQEFERKRLFEKASFDVVKTENTETQEKVSLFGGADTTVREEKVADLPAGAEELIAAVTENKGRKGRKGNKGTKEVTEQVIRTVTEQVSEPVVEPAAPVATEADDAFSA